VPLVATAALIASCADHAAGPAITNGEAGLTPALDSSWTEALMPFDPGPPRFCGGDGAASCLLPGGRTLWLFGDSCIATVKEGRYEPGWWMPNNVAVVGRDPPRGMGPEPGSFTARFGERPASGQYGGFMVPPRGGAARWCWPCDGAIVIGPPEARRLVIFYADMARRVENPSPEDVWNFRFVGNRVAIIENPEDALAQWRVAQHELSPRDPARMVNGAPAISWGVAVLPDHDANEPALLVFGVDGTNPFNKAALAARVPESRVADFSAWRFWTGSAWSDRESDARPVIENVVDEFTIHRQRFGDAPGSARWVLIQGEPVLGHRIFARVADSPLGPWSPGSPIYTVPEPSRDEKLITYGAKAHAHLSARDELLISYCINSLDFGALGRNVEIYRPRFIRVPLRLLAPALLVAPPRSETTASASSARRMARASASRPHATATE